MIRSVMIQSYGVTRSIVDGIRRGKTWKHV